MGAEVANAALTTHTLLHNGGTAIAKPKSITLPLFFDFCSLCEACVILDELFLAPASDWVSASPLMSALKQSGLIRKFSSMPPDDWNRLILRLPEELSRYLISDYLEKQSSETRSKWSIGDQRPDSEVDGVGALGEISYERGLGGLLSQLHLLETYPSVEPSSVLERIVRSIAYLIIASSRGLDYFPDYDRVPFVTAVIDKTYRSLPRKLYTYVADTLGASSLSKDELIDEWTLNQQLPIPPIAALILHRSQSLDEIPQKLLEARNEFAGYRQHFRRFKAELQAADTLKERRLLRRKYENLLRTASGPRPEIISAVETLNFAEQAIRAMASPALPTSYSALILAQPAEWIQRWWRRRPIAVLFRLDGKLPRISEYSTLIERLWGRTVHDSLLAQFSTHATQIKQIMSETPRTG